MKHVIIPKHRFRGPPAAFLMDHQYLACAARRFLSGDHADANKFVALIAGIRITDRAHDEFTTAGVDAFRLPSLCEASNKPYFAGPVDDNHFVARRLSIKVANSRAAHPMIRFKNDFAPPRPATGIHGAGKCKEHNRHCKPSHDCIFSWHQHACHNLPVTDLASMHCPHSFRT